MGYCTGYNTLAHTTHNIQKICKNIKHKCPAYRCPRSLGNNSSAKEKKQHLSFLLIVTCSVLISQLGTSKTQSRIQDNIVTLLSLQDNCKLRINAVIGVLLFFFFNMKEENFCTWSLCCTKDTLRKIYVLKIRTQHLILLFSFSYD